MRWFDSLFILFVYVCVCGFIFIDINMFVYAGLCFLGMRRCILMRWLIFYLFSYFDFFLITILIPFFFFLGKNLLRQHPQISQFCQSLSHQRPRILEFI